MHTRSHCSNKFYQYIFNSKSQNFEFNLIYERFSYQVRISIKFGRFL